MRLIFVVFALLSSIPAARSQSLEEVERRQAAVIEAWEKTPLTVHQRVLGYHPSIIHIISNGYLNI